MASSILVEIGRIGIGLIFLSSILLDIKTRPQLFDLMAQKNLPLPWLFYVGAIIWKAITSPGLILGVYIFWSALLLATYIFIANVILNNFWAVPKEQRDFTLAMHLIHVVAVLGLLAIAGATSN